MNLVQQSEQLKSLPDAALLQMQQRPTTVPPYLVVAEMQRRETMRKAAQDQGGQNPMDRKTVSQEMVGQMQQQAPAQPPQQMQGGMGAMKMAGGGLASMVGATPPFVPREGSMQGPQQFSNIADLGRLFSENSTAVQAPPDANVFQRLMGGDGAMAMTVDDMRRQGKRVSPADRFKELSEMRKSGLGAEADRLAEQEKELRGRKPKLGEIMMQLGLAMASSRNPSFLGALADGGVGALRGYTQDRNRREGQADDVQKRRIGLMSQIDQNADEMMSRAVTSANAENQNEAMYGQSVQANNRALAEMKARKSEAEAQRQLQTSLANATQQREDARANARSAKELAAAELKYKRDVQMAEAKARNQNKGGGGDNSKAEAAQERKATGLDRSYENALKHAEHYDKLGAEAPDQKAKVNYAQQAETFRKRASAASIASDLIRGIQPVGEGPKSMSAEEAMAWANNRPSGGQALTPQQRSMVHGPSDRRQITTEAGKQKQGLSGLFDYMQQQKSINDRFANAPR